MGEFFILIVLIAVIFGISAIFFYSKKSKLTKLKKDLYLSKINEIKKVSTDRQIVLFDSLLNNILGDLGYSGTIGEKLKKKPFILSGNLDKIWKLHKLRNKISHEIEITGEYSREALEYEKILKKILL